MPRLLRLVPAALLAAALLATLTPLQAETAATAAKALVDFAADGAEKRLAPTSAQVQVARSGDAAAPGALVTIQPGAENWPGVIVKPAEGAAWDLSAFGHVEARIVNSGAKTLGISLRIDNPGDWQTNPWNSETLYLKPGAAGTLRVIFGYSFGKPGFALKPGAVAQAMLFTGKADAAQSFRVESLRAAGPAGEKIPDDPASIRTAPKDGVIFGPGVSIDLKKQIEAKGDATVTLAGDKGDGLHVSLKPGKDAAAVSLKPVVGRWDLRAATEVRVRLKNDGPAPVTPQALVAGDSGTTDLATATSPLAPGATQEIVIPFAPAKPWQGVPNSGNRTSWDGVAGTGSKFDSDAAGAVRISAGPGGAAELTVESIVAKAATVELPEWLGKRPPVEGDWTKTFDDAFDGAAVDQAKWNFYGPNYWDKKSRWSKDNTIVGGGLVRLRYEKKTGFHNDDPKEKRQDYTSGFLETYGKWVQRYGYFEARMKLPTAPGLWPSFWMMPDRGAPAGPQGKRQSTENGGMEFDIMEHLTRWGPYRYNIAFHWDGYEKNHHQTGTTRIYVCPDKDGFITAGFLWLPGQAAFYCNGREVARWEDPRIASVPAGMMFTLPTGGWDNNPLDDARLPDDFVIDYVRVWQRKDLASAADGPQPPAKPDAK
ncbi:MAG: glycoside hydrolase family 16 protein [Planctomycetota bacterium]|nr:glycoside hydrolase family 16 protein [Planctomycetota bacterium]